jgi:hypothetical protein
MASSSIKNSYIFSQIGTKGQSHSDVSFLKNSNYCQQYSVFEFLLFPLFLTMKVQGYVMAKEVERRLSWSSGRAADALETLLKVNRQVTQLMFASFLRELVLSMCSVY